MGMLAQYEKKIARIKQDIEELHRMELDDDDQLRLLLYLRALAEEKSLYVDIFNKGQLSERSFRQLLLTLHRQIDAVRNMSEYLDVGPHNSSMHKIEAAVLRLIDRVSPLACLA